MGSLTPGTSLVVGTSIGEVPEAQPERTQYLILPFNEWEDNIGGDNPEILPFEVQINRGFVLCGAITGEWVPLPFLSTTLGAAGDYTASVYCNTSLVPDEFGTTPSTSCRLRVQDGATILGAVTFNPSNGVIVSTQGTISSVRVETFNAVDQDGDTIPVRRISFTFPVNNASVVASTTFDVNNGDVIAGGIQLEDGSEVSDYIPPIRSVVTRPFGTISYYLVPNSGSFTRSGANNSFFTFPGNIRTFWISAAAAGGAGGNPSGGTTAGSGGSAGACVSRAKFEFDITDTRLNFVVGAGVANSDGEDTTFGAAPDNVTPPAVTYTLKGGKVGLSANAIYNAGVAGGANQIGLADTQGFVVSNNGGDSLPGMVVLSGAVTLQIAGKGGDNFFSTGGMGAARSSTGGALNSSSVGRGPGAGGGGGIDSAAAQPGAIGSDGFILIEW